MSQEKRIIVTHCVDPHHFYFKYLNDCVNSEYSKFDYEVQCYGNQLYAQKIQEIEHIGYSPKKNEIIIFFDLIFNKWFRGRVINAADDNIILWCIDNGLFRRSDIKFILPLTIDKLEFRNLNLVHSGGLALLPAKKKLNVDTFDVELQVTSSWDIKAKRNFKKIVDSSEHFIFIEEMELGKHKFGSLRTESKNGGEVLINEILMQMNTAIAYCPFVKDMSSYISEERLEKELCRSHVQIYATISPKVSNSKITSNASGASDIKVSLMTDGANGLKSSPANQSGDDNLSLIVNFDNVSTSEEYFETFDKSASMVVSSLLPLEEEQPSVSRSDCHKNGDPFDYQCSLSTFDVDKNELLRRPLQSSIDWINQNCSPLANDKAEINKSLESSINDLAQDSSSSTLSADHSR